MSDSPVDHMYTDENQSFTLAQLGWRQFFQEQIDMDEAAVTHPARVVAVHRTGLHVLGVDGAHSIPTYIGDNDEDFATIGDWVLLDDDQIRTSRRLDRSSVFKRKAPGTQRSVQLIAANVDTLMIVASCNQDFNIARLERYLAVAEEAQVTPIIVLTKADMCDNPDEFRCQAEKLMPNLIVEVVNALHKDDLDGLLPWCKTGQTIAFVGSSGVGKSTLTNTLMGDTDILTQGVREEDYKGRHTTTHRAMYRMPYGGWVLDTPGIRELQLTDVGAGLAEVFSDIEALISQCKFRNCAHETEPNCAIRAALTDDTLDAARYARWQKLSAENALNSKNIANSKNTAQTRAKEKAFSKIVNESVKHKNR